MNAVPGTVYLVGAGPGDAGLITVRGLELLKSADVVVHDRLVSFELLGEAGPDAEVINVGKKRGRHGYSQQRINTILVGRAGQGLGVVRLKGGDPFVFGRGHEEVIACRDAGVPCVVVPGVSSALAAPAAAGIPVTHRGASRSVAIVTGQVAGDAASALDYSALAGMDTVVLLMGRAVLAELVDRMVAAGRSPQTPAACIENATTSQQRVTVSTLEGIAAAADRDGLGTPLVVVIGEVAACAGQSGEAALQASVAAVARAPSLFDEREQLA